MAHLVQIRPGLTGVSLPNNLTYSAGAVVSLSDDEFARLSAYALTNLVIDLGDPNAVDTSSFATTVAVTNALATKADLVGGQVVTSQLPALALVTAVPVANQAAMLALTSSQVQPGDLAVRADGAGTFMLMAANPSVLGNWLKLDAGLNGVTSVNGQVGTVNLGRADIGLGNVDNTSDANKPISTATQTALNTKQDAATAFTGNSDASNNTKLGTQALLSNAGGSGNVALGIFALYSNSTGTNNVAIGLALVNNTTGFGSVAIGYRALDANTISSYNVAVGYTALYLNTTGYSNVGMGHDALHTNSTGNNNTAVGDSALRSATTSDNTAFGAYALYTNGTGASNTAVGSQALFNNTTGANNTAVGYQALTAQTTGGSNVAVGYQAGLALVGGQQSVALGVSALSSAVNVNNNTAVGYVALAATTAHNNTAVGWAALQTATTGTLNTAIGRGANQNMTTASNTTALGANTVASGTGSVAIGIDSAGTAASATAQDEFVLGTALHTVKIPGALLVAGSPVGTSKVTQSGVALGTQTASQSAFTYYAISNVCKRGLAWRLTITADSVGSFDIDVRNAAAGGGTQFLAAAGVTTTSYDISVPVYIEGDASSILYVGIKNTAAASHTFTLTTLNLEKFA